MEPPFSRDGIMRLPFGTAHLQLQLHNNSLRHYKIYLTPVHVERTYIWLLQSTGFSNTKVIQCKIEIRRAISHCGMHFHSSIVANGHSEYLKDVTRDQCNQMHKIGRFLVTPSIQVSKLRVNETSFRSVNLAGSVTPIGDCTGTQLCDPYGTWNNVVVQAIFKITLQEHYATIHLNSNRIQLGTGILCTLSDTYCTEVEYGQTFWDTLPNDVCNFNKYEVIYEGPANKTHDNTTDNSETLYRLTTVDITFALAEKQENQFVVMFQYKPNIQNH